MIHNETVNVWTHLIGVILLIIGILLTHQGILSYLMTNNNEIIYKNIGQESYIKKYHIFE